MMKKNKLIKCVSSLSITPRGINSSYAWDFKRYFKAKAFGWKGTQLAKKRISSALKEINKINKTNKILAAEGSIYLMSRFWPAFQHIDTSSGSLGNVVNHAMEKLLLTIIEAPAELVIRQHWLDILWNILQNDGVDYVAAIAEYWGELSGYPDEASRRADQFSFIVKEEWNCHRAIVHFDVAYLSALFYSGRFDEILEVTEKAPYMTWQIKKIVARVLALTDVDKAINYAEQVCGIINQSQYEVYKYCEKLLIDCARIEEAYERYGIMANQASTYINWFNKIKKKYKSIKSDKQILLDLINSKVAEPGKWFAVANKLQYYDLAVELVQNSPADPKTLTRAAKNCLKKNPSYALEIAIRSLHWIVMGYGYEITNYDVLDAMTVLEKSAEVTNQTKKVIKKVNAMVDNKSSNFYAQIISTYMSTHFAQKTRGG